MSTSASRDHGGLVDVGNYDDHVDFGILACAAAHDLDLNGDAEPLLFHGVVEVQLRVGAELSDVLSALDVAAHRNLTHADNVEVLCVGPLQ